VKKDGMTEKSKGELLEAERLKVEKKNLVNPQCPTPDNTV
jgi:hypothetical protein